MASANCGGRHALGVTFGLLVAHVQRLRPALDSGVVGLHQLGVAELHVVEERGVVERQRRLAGHRFQEFKPVAAGRQRRAMEDFQHALDRALCQQRHPKVSHELLGAEQAPLRAGGIDLQQVAVAQGAAVQRHAAGVALAQRQPHLLDGARAEPAAGGVFQPVGSGLE
jgi:hypothetical protein